MALTPEDVVNKRFQPTKFREGYDQDEVDDFLDEVVVELRRLNQENEELKQRLGEAESAPAEPAAQPAPAQPAPVAAVPAVPAATESAPEPEKAAEGDDTESTNSLLQLARRLHDEHVQEGKEKRDALIAEGHATAARVVAEAESEQRAQIDALDKERTALEKRIEELRSFERDYRQSLKNYIEGQLKELDAETGSAEPEPSGPVSAAAGAGAGSDSAQHPGYPGIGG